MGLKTKKQLVSSRSKTYNGTNGRKSITVHETANTDKGTGAQTHANLQSNGFSESWHWQVDDTEAIQSYPHTVRCWHAGDGQGDGNLNSIGIEICVNSDGDFKKAVENAAKLVKKIMKDEGIPASNVVQHNHWSGKNCPTFLRSGSKGVTWNDFIKAVKSSDGKVNPSGTTSTSSGTSSSKTWTKVTGSWTGQTLRNGQYGNPVKQLQTKLSNNNPPFYPNKGAKNNGIDSYYGNDTQDAVERFQGMNGLSVDGLAGKATYNKLNSNTSSSGSNKANLTVDGKWGNSTTEALQKALGTPVDGIISKQPSNSVTRAFYGNTIQFGSGASNVVIALQNKVGATADGKLGPATVRALQKHLGTVQDGKLSRPSLVVKELQRRLNKGTF